MSILSRRRFVSRSVVMLGTTAMAGKSRVSSGLFAQGNSPVPPSDKIRVALVGSGGMGVGDLATFLLYPDVDCPVICDVDVARLAKGVSLVEEKRKQRPETVKDFRRVLDRKDVDVVLVATPDHWHALPTIYACQAGKDVYVEKPLATSIAEGRAMLEAAKRHNRVVQMGTQ